MPPRLGPLPRLGAPSGLGAPAGLGEALVEIEVPGSIPPDVTVVGEIGGPDEGAAEVVDVCVEEPGMVDEPLF
ncbi:hypothetical protein ACIBG0_30170 [Nocardia sp. NPDC050630]|uniref:hypothetical protein n=1 Tax=Nocardia sp. NPDC050630 TaxID=3364321 RepID=UPI0037AC8053